MQRRVAHLIVQRRVARSTCDAGVGSTRPGQGDAFYKVLCGQRNPLAASRALHLDFSFPAAPTSGLRYLRQETLGQTLSAKARTRGCFRDCPRGQHRPLRGSCCRQRPAGPLPPPLKHHYHTQALDPSHPLSSITTTHNTHAHHLCTRPAAGRFPGLVRAHNAPPVAVPCSPEENMAYEAWRRKRGLFCAGGTHSMTASTNMKKLQMWKVKHTMQNSCSNICSRGHAMMRAGAEWGRGWR